ncbi:O-antigen translocase [Myroides sp. 1354]|uniref:O-antigen translocase n=1 Tax=unclassified Myroides TaxID=2642485 RepID=UPI002574B75B|nr:MULTISPECIES: O-antigen translocase [unclassified Myroides]MDM1046242.1 O-antigen translocase [Myroides sp. R163-1]MDM1057178.1 O-antigen translocase [Myroides sp. 1354]MDM1070373.1 O-antigen translocase [Myroides sp. 1372]
MIKELWQKIKNSEFTAVTVLNTMGIIVRLITALFSAKILALFVGASGMAYMGNLRNTLASLEAFSSFGLANGIVQYVASHRQDQKRIEQFVTTLLRFMLGVLLLVSFGLFFWRKELDYYLFEGAFSMPSLFICLAFAFPLQVLNGIWIAFLTGLSQFKKVIYLNMIGNISGLLLTFYLVYTQGLGGALFAMILSPVVLFFVSLFWVKQMLQLKWQPFDFNLIKPLFSYAVMALFSAVVSPLCLLWIRKLLMKHTGIELAGIWEGIQRISGIYMLFITTLAFTYFLPKLAEVKAYQEKKKVIGLYFRGVLPLFALGLLLVYFMRSWIIPLILDDSFNPMIDLLQWQLVGDFLKGAALIYGLLFYTERLLWPYLFCETLFFSCYYGFTYLLIDHFDVEAATLGYTLSYIIYSCVLVVYFSWYFSRSEFKPIQ